MLLSWWIFCRKKENSMNNGLDFYSEVFREHSWASFHLSVHKHNINIITSSRLPRYEVTSHELSLNSRHVRLYAAVCTLCYTFTEKVKQNTPQHITILVLRHLGNFRSFLSTMICISQQVISNLILFYTRTPALRSFLWVVTFLYSFHYSCYSFKRS